MRTIELDPISFIASPEEKKFILLRSEKADKDEQFLKEFAIPKIINKENANNIPGVWGTLGYKSNKPIDWLGNLKCSNEGNDEFDEDTELYKEIEYLKYMYPDINVKREVKEKVIDLRNLEIKVPTIFEMDDVPELRMDIFLDEDEGALAFYQLRRHNATEKHIDFIQPQATVNNTTKRDRLSYHFSVIPKKAIEQAYGIPGKFTLSNENSPNDFIVKVLVFKRKFKEGIVPKDSKQIIEMLENDIEKRSNNLFAKKHRLLKFYRKKRFLRPRKPAFKRVRKKEDIDSTKKTLFLIHGTFASTKGSFGKAYSWIEDLVEDGTYEQVLAFDHPTLFDDAEENVLELYKRFAKLDVQEFTHPVDLIGTSQGGLIAQFMANYPNSYMKIGKVALVASANGVDYLTFGKNLTKGLKLLRKVFRKFGMGQAVLISALLQHSINWVINRKGLKLMTPGSDKLNEIMFNTPINPKTRYLPVIGNFSASSTAGDILEGGIDLILGKDNDWVVNTKNQFLVPSAYCALPEYNPGKYREYAVTNKNALHGRLIQDEDVQSELENFFEDVSYLESTIPESANDDLFDAHCHLFGRSVVSGRLVLMLLADIMTYFQEENEEELLEPIEFKEGHGGYSSSFGAKFKNFVKYFVLNKNAHNMLHDLEEGYYASFTDVYRYVPLMFDLEMTFKNSYDDDDLEDRLDELKNSFSDEHKKLVKKINSIVKKADKGKKVFSGTQSQNDSSIKPLKDLLWLVKKLGKLTDNLSKETRESFHKQLDELSHLKVNYGNDVFPFLATDPRRTNMGTYIEGQVGPEKTFHGIKLYTPNGYSPTDPNFFDPSSGFTHNTSLYKWCSDTKTPIMAHNSDAGFATFTKRLEVFGHICTSDKNPDGSFKLEEKNKEFIEFNHTLFDGGFANSVRERAHTLNHPTLWREVLKKYPDLKICLAHFGGGSEEWQKEIAKLIVEYDNVYTDLSCQTDIERLKEIKEAYFIHDTPENLKIRSRVMYGSDYFLNMLQGIKFETYYNNFREVFTTDEIETMSLDVPKTYLGLK